MAADWTSYTRPFNVPRVSWANRAVTTNSDTTNPFMDTLTPLIGKHTILARGLGTMLDGRHRPAFPIFNNFGEPAVSVADPGSCGAPLRQLEFALFRIPRPTSSR